MIKNFTFPLPTGGWHCGWKCGSKNSSRTTRPGTALKYSPGHPSPLWPTGSANTICGRCHVLAVVTRLRDSLAQDQRRARYIPHEGKCVVDRKKNAPLSHRVTRRRASYWRWDSGEWVDLVQWLRLTIRLDGGIWQNEWEADTSHSTPDGNWAHEQSCTVLRS